MGNRESGIVKSQPITHNQFSIHPIYLGLTQLNKSSPPSPPTLGGTRVQSPPKLGDLGGKCVTPVVIKQSGDH